MKRRRILATCAVTAAVLAAAAGSVAASGSHDYGWTAYIPYDGRRIADYAGQQNAAVKSGDYGWTGYDPAATGAACALFRSADPAGPTVPIELPELAEQIYDSARFGQDMGVRTAAKALADWVKTHGLIEVPAQLVKAMRTACYAYESNPTAT